MESSRVCNLFAHGAASEGSIKDFFERFADLCDFVLGQVIVEGQGDGAL